MRENNLSHYVGFYLTARQLGLPAGEVARLYGNVFTNEKKASDLKHMLASSFIKEAVSPAFLKTIEKIGPVSQKYIKKVEKATPLFSDTYRRFSEQIARRANSPFSRWMQNFGYRFRNAFRSSNQLLFPEEQLYTYFRKNPQALRYFYQELRSGNSDLLSHIAKLDPKLHQRFLEDMVSFAQGNPNLRNIIEPLLKNKKITGGKYIALPPAGAAAPAAASRPASAGGTAPAAPAPQSAPAVGAAAGETAPAAPPSAPPVAGAASTPPPSSLGHRAGDWVGRQVGGLIGGIGSFTGNLARGLTGENVVTDWMLNNPRLVGSLAVGAGAAPFIYNAFRGNNQEEKSFFNDPRMMMLLAGLGGAGLGAGGMYLLQKMQEGKQITPEDIMLLQFVNGRYG